MAKKKPTRVAIAIAGFLALGALCLGLSLITSVFSTFIQLRDAESWQETPAMIVANKLHIGSSGKGRVTYKATATYTYEFDGKQYESTKVSPYTISDNLGDFQDRINDELQHHRVRSKPFRCFVNPEAPNEAVLYRESRWGLLSVQLALGIAACIAGPYLLKGVYHTVRDTKAH